MKNKKKRLETKVKLKRKCQRKDEELCQFNINKNTKHASSYLRYVVVPLQKRNHTCIKSEHKEKNFKNSGEEN